MKAITKIADEKYIDKDVAIKRGIISKRTLRSSTRIVPVKVGKRLLLPIKSFSSTIQNRIKNENFNDENSREKDPTKESLEAGFVLAFIAEKTERHEIYSRHYKKYKLNGEQESEIIRDHAIIQTLINFKGEGYLVRSLFEAYRQLNKISPLSNFKCSSYDYFCAKLAKAEKIGIQNVIVNSKRGESRENKKFTKIHQKFAIFFYKNPIRLQSSVMPDNEKWKLRLEKALI